MLAFSSPFIEERLYLKKSQNTNQRYNLFSSPFIEERLYLSDIVVVFITHGVLVPFYRGAVVFYGIGFYECGYNGSRPLLSRSGCI